MVEGREPSIAKLLNVLLTKLKLQASIVLSEYAKIRIKFSNKHVLHKARAFFDENRANWWHTPPESSDLNPIENLCHELKAHEPRLNHGISLKLG